MPKHPQDWMLIPRESRVAYLIVGVAGLVGAIAFALAWYWAMDRGYTNRFGTWLYDWNVYHAAAQDLLDRSLYKTPLVQPGQRLPVEAFNFPPLAALWATPLLPLGREVGGMAWLAACAACVAIGMGFAVRAVGLWLAVAGIGLALYTQAPQFRADVLLGNNNHLMFVLLGAFVWAHLANRQRAAGVLLALAIGTKIWPIALVVLLLRERRWMELRWMSAGLAILAVATLAWIGVDGVGAMVSAIVESNEVRTDDTSVVLWTSAARALWDWWPSWGGFAVAALLLALPVTGRLGLGVGILAGLALNANLWHHYLLTLLLGVALILIALLTAIGRQAWWQRAAPLPGPEPER
jgi:Glycosyltransferase family 87